MRLKLLVVFFTMISLGIVPLAADTVMVYSGTIPEDASRDYLTAMESGLMDVFFETGHIVLSAREGSLRSPEEEADPGITVAKSQGAVLVIELWFDELPVQEELALPGRVEYRILSVADAGLLAEGSWVPNELRDPQDESDLDLVIRLGRELGEEAVALWN